MKNQNKLYFTYQNQSCSTNINFEVMKTNFGTNIYFLSTSNNYIYEIIIPKPIFLSDIQNLVPLIISCQITPRCKLVLYGEIYYRNTTSVLVPPSPITHIKITVRKEFKMLSEEQTEF